MESKYWPNWDNKSRMASAKKELLVVKIKQKNYNRKVKDEDENGEAKGKN